MKKSINIWAFPNDYPLGKCLDLVKDAGFEGIELVVEKGRIAPEEKEENLEKIRKEVEKKGLSISSLATGLFWEYLLTSSDNKKRKEGERIIVRMLEIAKVLGADTILVVPGAVNIPWVPGSEIVPYALALQRARESLERVVGKAEELQVNIGIENVWNRMLLSPLEFRDFIAEFGSPYLGAYFDVGNVLLTGFPEDWIRVLRDKIKKVHLKDFRLFSPERGKS
ncbi:MAG: sugar phosphate isomerase/epimerase [Caldiserica bacterium]|nr:sugar phosphate isomerase/epimerase [Caldisericota bacterium]